MDSIDKIQKRTFQYWYQDGITDLGFGAASLMLSLYFFLEASVTENTPIRAILDASLILLILGSVFLIRKGIGYLKLKLVAPRTGYIRYQKKSGRRRWLAGITGAVISGIISIFIINFPVSLNWMPLLTGFVVAFIMVLINFRLGLIRYAFLAFFSACEGILLATLGIGDILGLSLFYGSLGLLLVVLGGWLLFTYLRTHPLPQTDEMEVTGDE
jgi:hypothetical protein